MKRADDDLPAPNATLFVVGALVEAVIFMLRGKWRRAFLKSLRWVIRMHRSRYLVGHGQDAERPARQAMNWLSRLADRLDSPAVKDATEEQP